MRQSEIYKAAEAEMAAQRAQNEREHDARLARAISLDPEIETLEGAGGRLLREQARLLLTDPEGAPARMARAKAEAAQARADLRARLVSLGLPEDYLEPVFACPFCRDKGFVGDVVRRRCACFEKRVQYIAHENGSPLEYQNFDSFDESILPDDPPPGGGPSQRRVAVAARDRCKKFVEDYPKGQKRQLALLGGTGLGKTFLLYCVFARALEKGADARLITAYQAFEAMRLKHMGKDDEPFDELLHVPLLLIDDLGAEPLMKNITVEYLFLLLNERLVARRHTVVATNLSPKDIRERYGDRIYSRLFDANCGEALLLTGKDLRFVRRT